MIDRTKCTVCQEREGFPRYDRHGIYSGRACDTCAPTLPGQGSSWNYEPDYNEAIEPDEPILNPATNDPFDPWPD
jgi:hypothetical protein